MYQALNELFISSEFNHQWVITEEDKDFEIATYIYIYRFKIAKNESLVYKKITQKLSL